MRKYMTFLSVILVTQLSVSAQVPRALPSNIPINAPSMYYRTWEVVKPGVTANSITVNSPMTSANMSTQYVDGLGRPLQTVVKQGSLITGSLATDLISMNIYDEFGKERFKYLPTPASSTGGNANISNGLLKTNPFEQQEAFYNFYLSGQVDEIGEDKNWAYSQINFEASPLNRQIELFAPGVSWVGTQYQTAENDRRSLKSKDWLNTTVDSVRIWNVTGNGIGVWGNYGSPANPWYAAGELNKNISSDEHGKQTIEFKDKSGLTILKKVQITVSLDNGSGKGHHGWLSTYYLYDSMQRLRCVVQPRGVQLLVANSWNLAALSNEILNQQCFRYEYDLRGNMIMKKVPGAGNLFMVYDARDRLVLVQDSNMRAASPVQWMYTQYDHLNRPIATGLWYNNTSFSSHASSAAISTTYPNLSGQTYEELTRTFFDNYAWRSAYANPLSNNYNPPSSSYLISPSNSSWPYPQANIQSNNLNGMVTGTRVKVLGTIDQYLYNVNFYDNKGRHIQVQRTNISGGVDTLTTQYSWTGQPLITYAVIQKGSPNNQKLQVLTQTIYDSLWRLLKVEKKVAHSQINAGNMPATWTTILENQYDALGQLKQKNLATGSGSGGVPLDSLSFDYNIRGWLLGMNRLFAKDENENNYFGFDLGYDKTQNGIIGGNNYALAQYNGNISGTVWKSKGDNEKRKYDFSYDAANRILSADFNQYTGSVFNKSAGIDFSLSSLSYDANGNILSMKQRGWKGVASVTIDSMLYNYLPYSNRLLNVIDGQNDPLTKLGDFRTSSLHPNFASKNNSTIDYTYDGNGNLVKDLNKDIVTHNGSNGVEYNYLNLPRKLTIKKDASNNKGFIEYTYDATGNKLKKTVFEPGVDTIVTLYLAGCQFQNDTLQFISHEEGRTRFISANNPKPATFHYDYMIKDHLGNVRMLLTTQKDTSFYPPATLETAALVGERKYYSGVDTGRVDKSTVSGYPIDTHSSPNNFTQKLNGAGAKVGVNMLLRVMAGDKINIFAKSWYKKNGATPGLPLDPIQSILNILEPSVAGITAAHGGATLSQLQSNGTLDLAIQSFLNDHSYDDVKPKAFINWILFDEQFKYVSTSSGFDQIGSDNVLKSHTLSGLNVNKNGYLYIYVSNETPNIDVFFDNLTVTHIRGPILEETHYYPYGLTMAGISSKTLNSTPPNALKWNQGTELQNNELSDGRGLEIYATPLRSLCPQTGRWWQVDTKPDYSISLYASMGNNPILNNDPLGDTLRPLTTHILRDIARKNGFPGTGVQFNRNVGKAFESIGLAANGYGNENKKRFTSSERLANTGTSGSVIPDGVRAAHRKVSEGFMPPRFKTYKYYESSFAEVKAVNGIVNLDYNNYQIQGELDALRHTSGASVGAATMTFITTTNTIIGDDVRQYALDNNLKLFQIYAYYETDDNTIHFTSPIALTLSTSKQSTSLPVDITVALKLVDKLFGIDFNRSWIRPEDPANKDVEEVK